MFWWKVAFLVVIFITLLFLEKLLRRKWDIPRKSATERYVNDTHKWMNRYMFIGYILVSGILIFMVENLNIAYLILIYFVILCSANAWMEWKYDRESKEYKVEIYNLIAFVVFIALLEYLF